MVYSIVPCAQVWDFAKFQSYLTSNEGLPHDWVANVLTVSGLRHICCILYCISETVEENYVRLLSQYIPQT